jgi:hypothetical protein
VVAAPAGKPVRAGTTQSQERARRLALDPGTWSRDEAAGMAAEFDAMAASWEGDRAATGPPVLADALARGGAARPLTVSRGGPEPRAVRDSGQRALDHRGNALRYTEPRGGCDRTIPYR